MESPVDSSEMVSATTLSLVRQLVPQLLPSLRGKPGPQLLLSCLVGKPTRGTGGMEEDVLRAESVVRAAVLLLLLKWMHSVGTAASSASLLPGTGEGGGMPGCCLTQPLFSDWKRSGSMQPEVTRRRG